MSEALTYLYQVYSGFLDLVFDEIQIVEGVYLGWVLIAVFIFKILITNILTIPKNAKSFSLRKREESHE